MNHLAQVLRVDKRIKRSVCVTYLNLFSLCLLIYHCGYFFISILLSFFFSPPLQKKTTQKTLRFLRRVKMPPLPLLVVTVIVTSVYTVLATLSLNLCSNPRGTCYCYPQCLVEILNDKGIFFPRSQNWKIVLGVPGQTGLMATPMTWSPLTLNTVSHAGQYGSTRTSSLFICEGSVFLDRSLTSPEQAASRRQKY